MTPPVLQDVTVRPRVVSPDGDGRSDTARVSYRLSEPGRGALVVNGERRGLGTLFPRTEETIVWTAKSEGRPVDAGVYALQLVAVDRPETGLTGLRLSPLSCASSPSAATSIPVAAGARFAVRVSSDARRVRWTLGGRSGFAAPGTLRLRAPLQKGRFTLTVSANGYTARAAVFVREPLR